MALELGTNSGFVTEAPTEDPGASTAQIDNSISANKDTSPPGAIKITEIGWYTDQSTIESNFEVGVYSHDSVNNRPDVLLAGVSRTNAKGTTSGWKVATGLNIEIEENTIYWIAVQLDITTPPKYGETYVDAQTIAGTASRWQAGMTTLEDEWDGNDGGTYYKAIYAVWEAEAPEGTNIKINIADTWKDVSAIKVNIADTWKDVTSVKVNIADSWRTVF